MKKYATHRMAKKLKGNYVGPFFFNEKTELSWNGTSKRKPNHL
jgi:hypothetical protein